MTVTVLLVHSLGLDQRMWDPIRDRLAAGRRVLGYDIRGHGTAEGSFPCTMADLGADLLAVLDAHDVERAHVVGLSMGGAIAQSAAVAAPGRFASLTLLAAPDRPVPEAFEERARLAETEGMTALVQSTLERWFTPAALAAGTDGVRYARGCLTAFEPATWAAIWRCYSTLDVYGKVEDIPSLVLAGDADASIPVDAMRAIAGRIGARFEVVPGAPHQQTLEVPDRVADALDAFLPAEIHIP